MIDTEPILNGSSKKKRYCALAASLGAFGLSLMYADIDIGFSSTFDAVNEQSNGSNLDTSFTFELGSFDASFTPTSSNTNLWSSNWNAVPGTSSAGYTTVDLDSLTPISGATNNFEGSVTLTNNGAPFGTADQAYVWGYDDRGTSGTGEWILITNPDWNYPLVTGSGPQFPGVVFQVSDANTVAVFGAVNPEFALSGDDPHLVTGQVILAPVPEPSVAMLLCGGVGMLLARRRR